LGFAAVASIRPWPPVETSGQGLTPRPCHRLQDRNVGAFSRDCEEKIHTEGAETTEKGTFSRVVASRRLRGTWGEILFGLQLGTGSCLRASQTIFSASPSLSGRFLYGILARSMTALTSGALVRDTK